MDSVVLRAIYCWLRRAMIGGRLLSVDAQDSRTVFFRLTRGGLGTVYLLISWDPVFFRLYPLQARPAKSRVQTSFVATLRKHLLGSKVAGVVMRSLERQVVFDLVNVDLRGSPTKFRLIAELTGRSSNLVLVSSPEQRIIDAGCHIAETKRRPILPGIEYPPLPAAEKLNPLSATEDEMRQALGDLSGDALERLLVQRFAGLSPTVAGEIAFRARQDTGPGSETDRAVRALKSVASLINEERFEPCILTEPAQTVLHRAEGASTGKWEPTTMRRRSILSAFVLASHADWTIERFHTMSQAAEEYFARQQEQAAFEKLSRRLFQIVRTRLSRARRRLAKVEAEAVSEQEVRRLFETGELLKTNIGKLSKGMASVEVENPFVDPPAVEKIDLDPSKGPWANVDSIFRRAKKARRRLEHSKELITSINEEITYLEGLLVHIRGCDAMDCLRQVSDELVARSIITEAKHRELTEGWRVLRRRQPVREFRRFISSDGLEIIVGRNNAENDRLTLRVARPFDLFVHAQGVPGSHVIVRRKGREAPVPKRTVYEAAVIAATFSKARFSQNVPVDYTARSNVRKPRGSVPGKVIYSGYETVFVDPDEGLVSRLGVSAENGVTRG